MINNAEWQAIQGDLELWWNLLFEDLLLESLVGGEQAGGGLVPVFLHHLGHNRLGDSPGVESQIAGSLANHLLHLFLKHLVVMNVLLAIVPHGGLLSHSKHAYLTPLSALLALEELLLPVSLEVHNDEALGVQQWFLPPMPGTVRAFQGSRDAPYEN